MLNAGTGNMERGGTRKWIPAFAGMTGEMSGMFHAGRGVQE